MKPTILLILALGQLGAQHDPLQVGSKKFTESVILGEIIRTTLESRGIPVRHRREMGGTRILWKGLLHGDLDMYPEYTGTLKKEIFREFAFSHPGQLDSLLAEHGIRIVARPGFNNTYALGVKQSTAKTFRLETISDLADHPDLRLGFTNEFMDRGDGWPGLRAAYRLPQKNVQGLDHDLAYRGLEAGSIDVIDLYSTDAEIDYYGLTVLRDDRKYFPEYSAVILARMNALERYPELGPVLDKLTGTIPAEKMVAMNSAVKIHHQSESEVAADFVNTTFHRQVIAHTETPFERIRTRTIEHAWLVLLSLTAAILIALPLGILAARFARLGRVVLSIVGVIQTLPSLALLVFMIPFFGIGSLPAVIALFLYSLLPIVRNTHTGLTTIPRDLQESAFALGLSSRFRLRVIELPLALQPILAGIKTAAVLNVGTATIGALIGAGGYGQLILTGIRLDNMGLILEGALPAALMAILVQSFFDFLEHRLVSPGLTLTSQKD
ncbi:MAG: ABC transporter permease subunit [FCB group bacterium]|nr:ABC transporter permease subunit [FCB group bacterium]